MDSDILVSIVVLNWNGLEDTTLCLESLKNLNYKNFELILVDNGSADESKSVLPKLLKGFEQPTFFVDLPANTGFTGGHIRGLEKATGSIILLLNNDALVAPDCVDNALSVFKEDSKIAVVGGRSYFWNESNPPFNIRNDYYAYQVVYPDTAEVETQLQGETQKVVNNVSGACAFIRKSAIDKVGYLDPRFFAYYEETDLFARMKRAGYKIVYEPSVAIWHKVGASTKDKQVFYYSLIFKNQFVFAIKNFDRDFLRHFVWQYTKAFVRSCLTVVRRDNRALHLGRIRAFGWNILHLGGTLTSRRRLFQKLGGGYNDTLIKEQGAPFSIIVKADQSEISEVSLDNTLESLEKQTVVPQDILLFADIHNRKLAEKIAKKYSVRVVIDKSLPGILPENIALVCANQPWIIFLQAGDTLRPDFCREMVLTRYKNRSAKILYCESTQDKGAFNLRKFSRGNFIGSRFLFNKEFAAQSGGFNDQLAETDRFFEIILRTAQDGKRAVAWNRHRLLKESAFADPAASDLAVLKKSFPVLFNPVLQLFGFSVYRLLRKAVHVLGKVKKLLLFGIKFLVSPADGDTQKTLKRKYVRSFLHHLLHLQFRSIRHTLASLASKDVQLQQALTASKSDVWGSLDDIVVFVNCRDRVEPLKILVAWLESAGVHNIVFVDNGSSYPPLLRFFAHSPHQIIELAQNVGHTAPWKSYAVPLLAKSRYYVVSDPDVLPDENCPKDAVQYFFSLLQKYPTFSKAGFGLRIDDLPDHYKLKQTVVGWEAQFWKKELEPNVYDADIDTTFALYRPQTPYFLENSIRTGAPYVARHEPWYQDTGKPTVEAEYYRAHASKAVNTWNMDDIPAHFQKAIVAAANKKP